MSSAPSSLAQWDTEIQQQQSQSQPQQQPTAQPKRSPEDEFSNTTQMLVSGLTGMPTPNMTDADKASFAKGKAAGAISVPIVAGATAAATAVPEVVAKAQDIVQWAKANPWKATVLTDIANKLGVHPFDMLHSVIKYGKDLLADDEK